MRLVSLIIVVMVAFAANSLLNRAALASGAMGPSSFAALRLISGALCLAIMLRARGGGGRCAAGGGLRCHGDHRCDLHGSGPCVGARGPKLMSGTYKPKKYVLFFLNSCDHVGMRLVCVRELKKSPIHPLTYSRKTGSCI